MANLNIFGEGWTDVVFEGKNKKYGAYYLRNKSTRNTIIALILGVCVMAFLVFFFYLKDTTTELIKGDSSGEEITVIDIPEPPAEELPEEKVEEEKIEEIKEEKVEQADASKSVMDEKELTDVEVKKDEEVKKQVKTSQEEFNDNTTSGRQDREGDKEKGDLKTDGKQTGGAESGSQGTGTGDTFTAEEPDNKIYRVVQKKASPKGGMQAFYREFPRKFNTPDVPSGTRFIEVMLRFVVEKDGSFSQIQVGKDPHGAGDEAIRTLKSMDKWEPAEHNGKPVRSTFTLPIKIKVEE